MSRKHYERVAEIIRISFKHVDHLYGEYASLKRILIMSFCSFFKKDNPSFDKNKFIQACGGCK